MAHIYESNVERGLADRWSSLLEDGELIDGYYDFVVERTVVSDDEYGSMNIRLKFKESEDGVALYLKFKALAEAHKVASIVEGTVTSVKDYGAFVSLKIGVPALLHLKNMSWMKNPKSSDIVSVGDIVQCLVKELDFAREKVVLDLKSLHPNPLEIAYEQLAAGEIIAGPVTSVMNYGYFVELRPGVEGLLHKSLFSEFLQTNVLNKGDELRVVILSIDSARHRISLGLAE